MTVMDDNVCPECGERLILISIDRKKHFECNKCSYESSVKGINLTFKDILPSPDEILSTNQLLLKMGKTFAKKICRLTLDHVVYPLIEGIESQLCNLDGGGYRNLRM